MTDEKMKEIRKIVNSYNAVDERTGMFLANDIIDFINDKCSVKPNEVSGCGMCGGKLVEIRGRYPKEPKREVCPTCLKEILEQINEMSSKEYGAAKKNSNRET
jgi:hypothetical protein